MLLDFMATKWWRTRRAGGESKVTMESERFFAATRGASGPRTRAGRRRFSNRTRYSLRRLRYR